LLSLLGLARTAYRNAGSIHPCAALWTVLGLIVTNEL